jgi:hypothetical protein
MLNDEPPFGFSWRQGYSSNELLDYQTAVTTCSGPAVRLSATWADILFDAIDLVLWQADNTDMIATRANLLAPVIGADSSQPIEWCTAFAALARPAPSA